MIGIGSDVIDLATKNNRVCVYSNSVARIWIKTSSSGKCAVGVMPVPLSTYLLCTEKKFVTKELEILWVRRTTALVDVKNLSARKGSV